MPAEDIGRGADVEAIGEPLQRRRCEPADLPHDPSILWIAVGWSGEMSGMPLLLQFHGSAKVHFSVRAVRSSPSVP